MGLIISANTLSTDIPTPIKVEIYGLRDHHDQTLVNKPCTELIDEAHIGYEGPRISRMSTNLTSTYITAHKVSENLAMEVSLGRTAGPF